MQSPPQPKGTTFLTRSNRYPAFTQSTRCDWWERGESEPREHPTPALACAAGDTPQRRRPAATATPPARAVGITPQRRCPTAATDKRKKEEERSSICDVVPGRIVARMYTVKSYKAKRNDEKIYKIMFNGLADNTRAKISSWNLLKEGGGEERKREKKYHKRSTED